MKRIINVGQTSNKIDVALLLARVAIAIMMLTHGLPKMVHLFSGDPIQFPAVMGMSPEVSLGLTVFAEVICSILLLVGFTTRLAAIPLMITMLVAVLVIHSADAFAQKEMALHYLVAYIVLFIAGSGKYSIDYLLQRKLSIRASLI
ncbi:DoxX family protein [Flavisolibacter tropicus]|uniref:DoxX family protein n=1 Tax=Flavisolibacter tropicus TaxID=1492898 RepID=A0A172TQA1_9BACT|nr:DoxX family protein [Flavisolibacter tropicus]ANE49200.1 DoxX family protein [Flavisolibacter tropicus]